MGCHHKCRSCDRCWWEVGVFRCQQPEKVASSFLRNHLNSSGQAEVFIRRERESRTKRWRAGVWKVLYMQTGTDHSDKNLETGQGMVWGASSWFLPSWFYRWRSATLPELGWQKVRIYLLKLVPRILIQTYYLSTSYTLESAFTETMPKEWTVR